MTKTPQPNESKIKRIDFLKVVGANPDKKIGEICKEFNMSQSAAYNAINEYVLNCIWTDEDKDYPARVLAYYNKEVPNPDEQLNPQDVQQLRHFVDEYYEKHLPGGNMSKQSVHTDEVVIPPEALQQSVSQPQPHIPQPNYHQEYNNPPQEQYNRAMSQPPNYGYPPQQFNQQQFQRTDMSTDSGFLRNLLVTAKYVHPSIIDRFIQNYEMNKEIFDRDPLALLDVMKHMFTSQQGEIMWKLFQKGRGKFVTDAYGNIHPNNQGQMDPMLMMLFSQMMQGGNMNPQMMMPMMQQMGGQGGMPGMGGGGMGGMDPQMMMWMMMMGQMNQKSAKDQQKQDTNEMFEKLIQAIMLKMVGGATEDKKPWEMMYGGMNPMMGGMMGPPQVQEVLDSNGRVTQRNIVPSFGMMGQQQNHSDPLITAVLNNTMNTNTQLLMKLTDVGKTPTDILMSMIPYFKDSGNSTLQLTNMIKTMNEIAPGFFTKTPGQDGQSIEIAKLKFDTELAMQAQRMELSKMEHTWRIDEMDRKANNDNAQNWMHMIENLGGTFTEKVAPALMEGIGKGNLMGKPGQQQQPMDPMTLQLRMQQAQMRKAEQMRQEEKEEKMMQQQQQAQQEQVQQYVQAQQTEQQRAMMMIGQLQAALQQSEREKQFMANQLRDIQSVPTNAYRQGGPAPQINDTQLVRMQTGELQQMLQELSASSSMEQSLKGKIESILANRHLMDQHQPTQPMEPAPQEDFTPKETEEVSSEQTKEMEEHYDS